MTSLILIGQSLFLIQSIVQVLLSQRLHRKLQSSGGDHPLVHESELALGNGVVIFLAIVGILGIIGSGTEIFVQIFPQAYLLNLIAQLAEFLLPRVLFFFLMMVIERVWLDLRSRGAIAVAYLITAVVGQSDIYNWYYLFDFSNADFYTALTWIALIFPYAFASFMGIILYRRGVPHRAIVSVIATLALFWVLPVVVDSAIYHLGPLCMYRRAITLSYGRVWSRRGVQ